LAEVSASVPVAGAALKVIATCEKVISDSIDGTGISVSAGKRGD